MLARLDPVEHCATLGWRERPSMEPGYEDDRPPERPQACERCWKRKQKVGIPRTQHLRRNGSALIDGFIVR